jgi:aminopeptidase N
MKSHLITKISLRRLAGLWLLSACALTAQAEAPFSYAETPGKLPKDVRPLSYAVHIVPDLDHFKFDGDETVEIEVLRTTASITLNALEIEIDQALLSGPALSAIKLTPQLDRENQTVRFALAKPIMPGRYRLKLGYHGVISRQAHGLYYDHYATPGGDKLILATEMEPADARRLLPCWDEPVFRATFKLTVDVPQRFKAFSNTPVVRRQNLGNAMQRVAFGATPKMASYLLVLVAGELERSVVHQDGVEIGVVTTAGKQGSSGYALASSQALLHYYNDYFGTRYPLKKLDHIAVPNGFGGAMENWGGIVYNESALLVDPAKSPESTRQRVFSVTAHEMAHQWFGDMVTMAWWDNLWLNEGFASWMEAKANAHFNPEWRVRLRAHEAIDHAMMLDALPHTHPIQQAVDNEGQANDAFDAITYSKGRAFLQMLESYLGEDAFRQGIRAYIARHQYSNTTSADLWAALAKASGKPVAEVAAAWTTQPGFPIISVTQQCEGGKDNAQRRITFSQQQFQSAPASTSASASASASGTTRLWPVPIEFGLVGGKTETFLLRQPSSTIVRPGCDGALLLDPNDVGYYRVQYDPALFDALATQAAHLPDSARLKLLVDTWAQVGTGQRQLAGYLRFLTQLGDEPRLAVWEQMLDSLEELNHLAAGTPLRPQLHQFIDQFTASKFKQLGWDEIVGESTEHRQLRARLILALAATGNPAALAEARVRFQRFLSAPDSLPPSILDPVLMLVARYADQDTYDAINALGQRATGTEEKNRYFGALAAARDPKLAQQSLRFTLRPDLAPLTISRMIHDVAENDHVGLTWAFVMEHADFLRQSQGAIGHNRFFPAVLAASTDAADADALEIYAKAHLPPDAMVAVGHTAEAIRLSASVKALLLPQLGAALQACSGCK